MSDFTRGEASAFIEAMRLAIQGKVGFKWLSERISGLADYLESLADENEAMGAYIDSIESRADYEAFARHRT